MTPEEWAVISLTVQAALLSTLVTLPPATLAGWFLARKSMAVKPLLESVLSLPLVAPPVVTGYLLLVMLGRNGVIGRFLYQAFGVKLTFNFAALVIASVVVSFPLAVRSIRSAFELVDPIYEKVSHTLGAPKWHTFFRVSLPMALPGVLSGAVLTFARSLGEFGATITLAGNISGKTRTIALMVYSHMQVPGMEMQVARLVAVSILISFAAILGSEMINRRGAYFNQ